MEETNTMPLRNTFLDDSQGRRYTDVLSDPRYNFDQVLNFFDDERRQDILVMAEERFETAPLVGVVKEFESIPWINDFFRGNDGHTTTRFRQAVGVVVKVVMAQKGWHPIKQRAALGQRRHVAARTRTPGAYQNDTGISKWFTRAARYVKCDGVEHPKAMTGAELIAQLEADGVIGAWADRSDITDSAAYARELRHQAEHREW
jgi:hypothetical protein